MGIVVGTGCVIVGCGSWVRVFALGVGVGVGCGC